MIAINSRYTGEVLVTSATADTLRDSLRDAVMSGRCLTKADLRGADLSEAELAGANLHSADLCRANLCDANLRGADLGGANLHSADLRQANLSGADLRGADLSEAELAGANLHSADLTEADLRGANLCDANLSGANLGGANLCGANLCGANLHSADLRQANLSGANLGGADLHSAIPDDLPIVPRLHARMLEALESGGALDMVKWHGDDAVSADGSFCGTTHCRAGWAVALAGAAGSMLEACYGPNVAGALITLASTPELEGKVPDFYASNEVALEDICRVAALEQVGAVQS